MIIGKVIGNVWATRKEDALNGLKLMAVQREDACSRSSHESFVAVDCVGAGTDERVLVVTGSSARKALGNPDAPVDAAIVGIIDEVKIRPES
jgi:ethanolamine utilization protein EutN